MNSSLPQSLPLARESTLDVYTRQILTSEVDPRTVRVHFFYNGRRAMT